MTTLSDLINNNVQAQINGKWVPARPMVKAKGRLVVPFWRRLRDAWEVLRGRADAFKWPEGQ